MELAVVETEQMLTAEPTSALDADTSALVEDSLLDMLKEVRDGGAR